MKMFKMPRSLKRFEKKNYLLNFEYVRYYLSDFITLLLKYSISLMANNILNEKINVLATKI